jgi:SAM-dependent methyltransferase
MLIYYLTIFLAAFLLFQVEPMLVKYLLPWFGGSSAVWTTSLLFFQLVLLGGYAYSHILGTRMRPRNQARSHLALILISLLMMGTTALVWRSPITPGAGWKPLDSASPVLHLLILLTVSIGLPYFVLAATAPLLQSWFTRSSRHISPYRLYSLSNFGSLLALISYPFVVEPNLAVRSQALIWSALYASFGIGMVFCAARQFRIEENTDISAIAPNGDAMGLIPTRGIYLLWILLAACGSLMLLATTSQLTQDVAPIPFLWILPLTLYLLSFIICFDNQRWYDRRVFHCALGVAIVIGTIVLCNQYSGIVRQIVVFSVLLFCVCMVCHGELVRLRPDTKHLTAFYLMVSIGGAAGGLFAAIIAPHIFRGYWEFQLSIWGSVLLLFLVLMRDRHSWIHQRIPALTLTIFAAAILLPWMAGAVADSVKHTYSIGAVMTLGLMGVVAFRKNETGVFRKPGSLVQFAVVIGLVAVGKLLFATMRASVNGSLRTSRNFYGTLAVFENDTSSPQWHYYVMRNGRIIHGRQYPEADKRRQPTAYYGPGSGIGLLMLRSPRGAGSVRQEGSFRAGVVGLGVGTIAAYGRPGDYIRYYEINPDVIKTATDPNGYFTFLGDSRAKVEIIPGDARLSMERELRNGNPQQFDVLTIDAFSGDAVPVHLITQEAIAIYLRQLKPDGLIVFHITNGYLDFKPVLWELAQRFRLRGAWIHDVAASRMCATSDWVLLSRNDRVLGQPGIAAHLRPLDSGRKVRLWTDDYSNFFQILK